MIKIHWSLQLAFVAFLVLFIFFGSACLRKYDPDKPAKKIFEQKTSKAQGLIPRAFYFSKL